MPPIRRMRMASWRSSKGILQGIRGLTTHPVVPGFAPIGGIQIPSPTSGFCSDCGLQIQTPAGRSPVESPVRRSAGKNNGRRGDHWTTDLFQRIFSFIVASRSLRSPLQWGGAMRPQPHAWSPLPPPPQPPLLPSQTRRRAWWRRGRRQKTVVEV